jgi:hypothetical protein
MRYKHVRKYERYPTHCEGRYFLDATKKSGEICTMVNICRKGMGVIFHTDVEIEVGATIRIEIPTAVSSTPISVIGILRWFDKMDIDSIGGIELKYELSDVQFSKISFSKNSSTQQL